jgi:hypothetical protein
MINTSIKSPIEGAESWSDYLGGYPSFTRLHCPTLFKIVALMEMMDFAINRAVLRETPPMCDAGDGREGVMKILWRESVNPSSPKK